MVRSDRGGMRTCRLRMAVCIAANILALGLITLLPGAVLAEPYLAVFKGMQCSACHSQPAGGGKRNVYGNVFAQTEMPAERWGDADGELWTGEVLRFLGVGADVRADFRYTDVSNNDSNSEFGVQRATLYIEGSVIPNRLSIYIDQQLAPGSSLNREAYLKVRSTSGKWHLIAGQFFLPYGLRLQDDTAFVREVTGVNFFNSRSWRAGRIRKRALVNPAERDQRQRWRSRD